jgi:PST family polysaccharide transporter
LTLPIAPWLAQWAGGSAAVGEMLRLLSLNFAIGGLRNLHVVRFHHQLRFGIVTALESIGSALGTILSIGLLAWRREPGVLVIGVVSGYGIGTLMSWAFAPRRARLALDRAELLAAWRFTRYLLANSVIIYALLNLDDILVARLAGLAALGLYSMSYSMVNSCVLFVLRPLGDVVLPALARVRRDVTEFTQAVVSTVSVFSSVSWFMTCGAWVLAEEVFAVIHPGGAWQEAVPIFRALVPFVLVRGINNSLGSMLVAAGRPDILTRVSGAQLVLMVPSAFAGFWIGGFLGLTLAITILNVGAMAVLIVIAPRFLSVTRVSLLATVLAPMIAAVPAALLAGAASRVLYGPALRMGIGIVIALSAFVVLWELVARTLSKIGSGVHAISFTATARRLLAHRHGAAL